MMLVRVPARASAEGLEPAGDVIFCALADEEGFERLRRRVAGARARRAVRGRPATRSASSAASRCTTAGARFYPIQVAEKQVCTRAGDACAAPGGHGAMPVRGGAMARARASCSSSSTASGLPVHVTPVVREMCRRDGRRPRRCARRSLLRLLLNPRAHRPRARPAWATAARVLDPLLHNTVSPTMRRASDKFNVIPSEVERRAATAACCPASSPTTWSRELRDAARRRRRARGHRATTRARRPPTWRSIETLGGVLARARPRRRRDPAADAGRDRRALLRAARHPDLRLHADEAAAGLRLLVQRARRRRARPRRRASSSAPTRSTARSSASEARSDACHDALGADAAVHGVAAARAPRADRGRRGGRLRRPLERRDDRPRRLHAARARGRLDRAACGSAPAS